MAQRTLAITILAASLALVVSAPAYADHLIVAPTAPLWMRAGADAILYSHIGGGLVGICAGAVALAVRKGGKLHRLSGDVFVVAMLIMSGIGAAIAPLLHDRGSTMGGLMTFYLIVTSWLTVRRREGVGAADKVALAVSLSGACGAYYLSWLASHAPGGALDGTPPQAFYVFTIVTTIAAFGDLKLVLGGGLPNAQRIARHVWRTCTGLFVASGSFFLGQMQVFPVWLRHTPVLYMMALAPLPFLIFWMVRVRTAKKWRGTATTSVTPSAALRAAS